MFWEKLESEILASAPDLSKSADDELFVESVRGTVGLCISFARVANGVAEMEDVEAAKQLYKGFERIADKYYLPRGISGGFSDWQFDFFKFLGHELFVMMFSPLVKEGQWEFIGKLLDERFYVANSQDGQHIFRFTYLNDGVSILSQRSRRLGRYSNSERVELLRQRHTIGDLASLVPFDDFAQADYLLYLRSLAFITKPDDYWLSWTPYSMAFLGEVPAYLIRGQSKQYAEELMLAIGTPTIQKLRDVVAVAAGYKAVDESPIPRNPLRGFNQQLLGSRTP